MNDRYDILQLLTKDQVGGVYLAEDTTLERKVAFRNFERVGGEEILTEQNDEFAEFSGKLTALQHPNLITIFDIAFDDGEAYMVTQYMEDESLAERLESGPLPQDRVYRMASDVLEALHAAHESGVFHGALNTESVRRIPKASGGHRYMVVDMGLNHLATLIRGAAGGIVDPILEAPELHDGATLNARADLFMLGQLCYTALAGGHPFAEKSKEECAELYRNDALPPIEDYVSGVQPEFMEWIKYLAKGDPEQRPADTEEAMKFLNEITLPDPEPISPAAVFATPPVVTAVATATAPMVAASPSQAMAHAEPVDAQIPAAKSKKLPLIIIASLVLVIGGLSAFLIFKKPGDSNGSGAANASGLPAAPDGVLVHLHKATPIESEPVDLEAGSALDWSVTTGVPVSSSRKRMQGGKYIPSVLQVLKDKKKPYKELPNKTAVIKFEAGDTELVSKGIINKKSKAKAGDGWEVYLRIPAKHKGPLLVNCYILHKNCGFTISTKVPKEKKPIDFKIDGNDVGKSHVLLEIPEPAPNGFYTFKILAAAPTDGEAFTFGLGAIQVGEK